MREKADPSNPKRINGSFTCMVSTDRSTHPPAFVRRAGCHTSLGCPRRCQLLLDTIEQAKGVWPWRVTHRWSAHLILTKQIEKKSFVWLTFPYTLYRSDSVHCTHSFYLYVVSRCIRFYHMPYIYSMVMIRSEATNIGLSQSI